MSAPPEPDPPPQKLGLTEAEFDRVNEPRREGEPASNDPMEMLRQNRAHEKAAGTVYDQSPAPVKRNLRRYRDYFIVLVTVDAIFGGMLFYDRDPFASVPLAACLALFTGGWSWFMLVVVDDY